MVKMSSLTVARLPSVERKAIDVIPFGLLGQAGLSALLHVLKDTRLVRGIVESIKVHFILATVQVLQDQFK